MRCSHRDRTLRGNLFFSSFFMYSSLGILFSCFSIVVCLKVNRSWFEYGCSKKQACSNGRKKSSQLVILQTSHAIDLKKAVDNLPSDGITKEELDRVLAEGNFRPKTDMLLKEATGVSLLILLSIERMKQNMGEDGQSMDETIRYVRTLFKT